MLTRPSFPGHYWLFFWWPAYNLMRFVVCGVYQTFLVDSNKVCWYQEYLEFLLIGCNHKQVYSRIMQNMWRVVGSRIRVDILPSVWNGKCSIYNRASFIFVLSAVILSYSHWSAESNLIRINFHWFSDFFIFSHITFDFWFWFFWFYNKIDSNQWFSKLESNFLIF